MLRLSYELKKQIHEVAGWRGPMTQRQLLVWLAWLPTERFGIEFRPIDRKPAVAPPSPKYVLTKEKIRKMRKDARIAQLAQPARPDRLGLAAQGLRGGRRDR